MEQFNPYSAPQTATIVSSGSNFNLTEEYLIAAKGGKTAYLGISTMLLCYFFGILISMLLKQELILLLAMVGCFIGLILYIIGLFQLTAMPQETGAKTMLQVSFYTLIGYLVLMVATLGWFFLLKTPIENMLIVISLIYIIQTILSLLHVYVAVFAQRKLGHYCGDRKLLSYNMTATVLLVFYTLVFAGLFIVSGTTSNEQAMQSAIESLGKQIGFIGMLVISIVLLVGMLVYVFSYSNAYKRIYDSAQEQLKRNSAGLASQSNNLFQNLP